MDVDCLFFLFFFPRVRCILAIIQWMKTLIPICPTYSGGDVSYTYPAEDRAKSSDFKEILNQFYSYPCTDLVPRLV